jgi:hypothetical protein
MAKNKSNKISWRERAGYTSGQYAGGHERLGEKGGDVQIEVKPEGLDIHIIRPNQWGRGKGIEISAEDIESIEFSQADEASARATLTRMGVGTILLPGIGTMIGFMAKKKKVKTETLALVRVDEQPIVLLVEGNEFKARTIFSNLAEKIA